MRAITFISLVPREKCVESLTKKLAVLKDKRQAHAWAVKADLHDDSSKGAGDAGNNETSSRALVILLDAKAADVHEWLTSCDVAKDGKERDQVIAKIALALDKLEARLFAGEEEESRWLAGRRYCIWCKLCRVAIVLFSVRAHGMTIQCICSLLVYIRLISL